MNRGIVMGIEKRHSIVLTPDGQFQRVPTRNGVSVGDEIQLNPASRVRKPKMLYSMGIGAAAVMLLLFVPLFMSLGTTDSSVVAYLTMDINPSIEIGVDGQEKVIELRAMNESARKLTQGMKYEGLPVEHVAETIMDRVDAAHYFDSGEGDVLIASVLVKETGKADFEYQLTAHVDAAVKKSLAKNDAENKRTVQVNTVSAPKEVRDEANEVGLSSGKMAFYLVAKSQGREVDIKKLKRTSIHKTAKAWGGVGAVLDDKKQADALKAEQRQKEQKKKLEELLKKEKQQREKNKEDLTAKRNDKASAVSTGGKVVPLNDPNKAKDTEKDKKNKEKEKNKEKITNKEKEKDWKAYRDKNEANRDKTDIDNDERSEYGWNKKDDDDDDDDDRTVIQAKNFQPEKESQEKNTNTKNDSDDSDRSGGQEAGKQASGGRHPAVYPSPSENGKRSDKEEDMRKQENKREQQNQQDRLKQQEKEKEKEKQKELQKEREKEKQKQKEREQAQKNDKERGRDDNRH